MKNKIVLFLFLSSVFAFSALQSCNKYQDGPTISFKSRTERVANTWKVDNYKKNGNDLTSLMVGYIETFTKSGNYSYSIGGVNGTGVWSFQNKDTEIRLTGTEKQKDHILIILKLEEKEFWYYYMDDGDRKEFHLIEN